MEASDSRHDVARWGGVSERAHSHVSAPSRFNGNLHVRCVRLAEENGVGEKEEGGADSGGGIVRAAANSDRVVRALFLGIEVQGPGDWLLATKSSLDIVKGGIVDLGIGGER